MKVVVAMLLFLTTECASYSCQTPDSWQDEAYPTRRNINIRPSENIDTDSLLVYRRGTLWPNSVVKFYLNETLTFQDKLEVFSAIDEYHKKTCIRFEEVPHGTRSSVSIEVDNSICGLADVCKRENYQFARFGGICRDKKTMVHELGHSLCLKHEHQREDRDTYVQFETCSYDRSRRILNASSNSPRGFYDYSSQMHYTCGSCLGGWPTRNDFHGLCGPQITSGLSVLDADHINELYNCQGCYRHRWVAQTNLQESHKQWMYSFGYLDLDGKPLYPCRAFYRGELLIGKYKNEGNAQFCRASYFGTELFIFEAFEVLIIPGGLETSDSTYQLETVSNGMSIAEKYQILDAAVIAGHLAGADGSGVGNGYIDFSKLRHLPTSTPCSDNPEFNTLHNGHVGLIGKVWKNPLWDPTKHAYVSFCFDEFAVHNYRVLTCENHLP